MAEITLREPDKFDDEVLKDLRKDWSDQEWMRNQWTLDFYDMMGADYQSRSQGQNPLNIVKRFYDQGDDNDWKDKTNIGGIKIRAKTQAIKSQIMQAYTQGFKVPFSMKDTPISDFEEQNGQNPSNAEQSEKLLKTAEEFTQDKLVESGLFGQKLEEAVEIVTTFGSVCAESPIERKVPRRLWNPIMEINAEGQEVQRHMSPGWVLKTNAEVDMFFPWELLTDGGANGNVQTSKRATHIKYIDKNEASRLADLRGDDVIEIDEQGNEVTVPGERLYDADQIKMVLDDIGEGSDNSRYTSFGDGDPKRTGVLNLSDHPSKTIETLIHYGRYTRRELEKWEQTDILEKIDADTDLMLLNETTAKEWQSYELHVVYMNGIRVFLEPLGTADRRRPLEYTGFVHLKNTNYFFSSYSEGRPASDVMNTHWRRSSDSIKMTNSWVGVIDDEVIDGDTVAFEPGKIWRTHGTVANTGKSVKDAVHQFVFQPIAAEGLQMVDRADDLLDEITMTPKNLSGISAGADQTATEITTNMSSAQIIMRAWLKRFDKFFMIPICTGIYNWLQARDDTPQNARCSAIVRVFGAETFANQVINKRMALAALQILGQLSETRPDLIDKVKVEDILTQYFESLGYQKEDIIRDEESMKLINMLRQENQQLNQALEQMKGQIEEIAKRLQKTEEDKAKVEADKLKTDIENRELNKDMTRVAKELKTEFQNKELTAKNEALQSGIEQLPGEAVA